MSVPPAKKSKVVGVMAKQVDVDDEVVGEPVEQVLSSAECLCDSVA